MTRRELITQRSGVQIPPRNQFLKGHNREVVALSFLRLRREQYPLWVHGHLLGQSRWHLVQQEQCRARREAQHPESVSAPWLRDTRGLRLVMTFLRRSRCCSQSQTRNHARGTPTTQAGSTKPRSIRIPSPGSCGISTKPAASTVGGFSKISKPLV